MFIKQLNINIVSGYSNTASQINKKLEV